MAIFRVQHTFQGVSLQPEDRYVNVFYFQHVTPLAAGDGPGLAAAIRGFYEDQPTGQTQLSHFMSGIADSPGATVKIYDMGDPPKRHPVYEETYSPANFGSGVARNLPDEVALCLSFQAAPVSGLPQGRRRGRIYLGPLNESALATAGNINDESGPNPGLMSSLLQAALDMASVANTFGFDWSVYSPTLLEAISITTAWVDNAWDTQRRRGNKPTARVTAAVAP